MESEPDGTPLVVIVGETASGKTALAHALARQFNGEIIAADSRTIYKGMDIGTAKPTAAEQSEVRYHLLDIMTPNKPITAADFKQLAQEAVKDISARGKVPFLVGGSGLYIDAVLYDFAFAPPGDEAGRRRLHQLPVEALQAELKRRGIPLPSNSRNPRHLIRQLETGGTEHASKQLRPNTLTIGLPIDRPLLERRIVQRVGEMFAKGLTQEVERLAGQYSWDSAALQTIGYQEFAPYLAGEVSLELVQAEIVKHTLQFAKRQRTWFRRNKSIHWTPGEKEAVDLITTFLNK